MAQIYVEFAKAEVRGEGKPYFRLSLYRTITDKSYDPIEALCCNEAEMRCIHDALCEWVQNRDTELQPIEVVNTPNIGLPKEESEVNRE